jgi:transcriptional regulator with PAS, ATPase and Fis domain
MREQFQFGGIFSSSASMCRVLEVLPRMAQSSSNILIQGETGTGKELVARAIHNSSARQSAPFVAVNCGALPDSLLESELFGYKAGAFTGAIKDKPGRFALAGAGTLFLDEIGDVSPALQVRLLRVLQEKQFDPLGATSPEHTRARVIAATHRDLGALVAEGVFRQDLYYRIKVVKLELPPLRCRKEDIPLLAQHFIDVLNSLQGKEVAGLSPAALRVLTAHDYPGNVRELQNIVEHAFVHVSDGLIDLPHLPPELVPSRAAPFDGSHRIEAVKAFEESIIRAALERNNGNRIAAARDLGMHKSTFFRKVRLLGIDLPERDGRSRRGR